MSKRIIFAFLFSLVSMPAHAYLGPGVGAGALAAILGVIAAVGMAFVAVLWFPIKRMLKARKNASADATTTDEANPE